VMEANFFRNSFDGCFWSGEKMPAGLGCRTTVALQVTALLLDGEFRALFRINADEDEFKITTRHGGYVLHCLDQSIRDLTTQHRAAVISGYNHNWLAVEILAKRYTRTVFIEKTRLQ